MRLKVESVLERQKFGNDDKNEGRNKNREVPRPAEPIRVSCSVFMASFATSPDSVKGTINSF